MCEKLQCRTSFRKIHVWHVFLTRVAINLANEPDGHSQSTWIVHHAIIFFCASQIYNGSSNATVWPALVAGCRKAAGQGRHGQKLRGPNRRDATTAWHVQVRLALLYFSPVCFLAFLTCAVYFCIWYSANFIEWNAAVKERKLSLCKFQMIIYPTKLESVFASLS